MSLDMNKLNATGSENIVLQAGECKIIEAADARKCRGFSFWE